MESRTWWTVEPTPDHSRHSFLNRRKDMRMCHVTEILQVKSIYKTFLQAADFPQESALQSL